MALFDTPIPFEKRDGYTDLVVSGLVARAEGTAAADASQTAALEIAAGQWACAMAAARVEPAAGAAAALTPAVMHLAGRQAIRRGEALFVIDVDMFGRVRLMPAWTWDVHGGIDPDSWWYRVEVSGPDGSRTRTVPAVSVVHLTYATDPASPWRGLSPMALAARSGELAGNLETRLSQEAGAPVGSVIPVPVDGGDGGRMTHWPILNPICGPVAAACPLSRQPRRDSVRAAARPRCKTGNRAGSGPIRLTPCAVCGRTYTRRSARRAVSRHSWRWASLTGRWRVRVGGGS